MHRMTKKTATPPSVGARIRVKAGVAMPEFPDVLCEGWCGHVVDHTGKKADRKYVVEWDDTTLQSMPPDYVDQCEQNCLYYRMACFADEALEVVDE